MSVQRQFFWIILSLYLGISSTAFAGSKRDEDVEKYIVRIGRGDVTDTCVVYRTKTYPGPEREWEQQVNKSVYFAGWNGYRDGDVVTVWVQKIGSRASSAIVRPERNNIGALKTFGEANERRVVFKVSNPTKISVEFDDDPKNNEPLLIFIGREEASGGLGSTAGKKYVYTDSLALSKLPKEISSVFFGPGRHAVGLWKVPTNVREIFIQEGAVLQGYIYAERADNNPLIIRGGGIISNEGFKYHFPSNANIADYESSQNWYKAIQIEGGKGHLIEGITIIDPSSYIIQLHASDSIISNVKMLGFRMNNDAVTLSGKNNKIEDCFIRVNDDAIVLRDVQGLTVKNCVFWQLTVGSIFQLGWTAHDISDLTVENCDVIHADWNYEMENSGFINL
ncbi:MAG: right-handed parallel beta-helix repeat-containing protein, partial [Polynucleobacter sp.]|nr:right-handed parallel beta-helix repeat-containing protein [Polynucleobacter sp.]